MAITGWSIDDYLQALSALWSGAEPFGVSWWHWVPTGVDPTSDYAWSLGQAGLVDHHRGDIWHATGGMAALARDTSTNGAITTASYAFDAWNHTASEYVSSTLRGIYLDGANLGTNTDSKSINAPDATYIGQRPDIAAAAPSAVGLASWSIWDLSGFSAQDRADWAAELASGANPNDMDAQVGQPWTGALVAYASLFDLTAGSLGSFTEVGTLSTFASHPPVTGEGSALPGAPTLVADATAWDAAFYDLLPGSDTSTVDLRRSTSTPVTEADSLVTSIGNSQVSFVDPSLTPETTYFYRAFAANSEGTTPSDEEQATTFSNDAIETFNSEDSIAVPFNIPAGQQATEVRLKAGIAYHSGDSLDHIGGILVEVQDESATSIGAELFPNDFPSSSLLTLDDSALSERVVTLSPPADGPQTISAIFTSQITTS